MADSAGGFVRGYEVVPEGESVKQGAPSTEKTNQGMSKPGPDWAKQGK